VNLDYKQLPLQVAVKDAKTRRTVVAAVEAASLRWASSEAAVSRTIRENSGLRSTERRFVGEAAWTIIRRYEPYSKLAREILPKADTSRRTLLLYFIYLVLEKQLPPELAREPLEQAGLPSDIETWPAKWQALFVGLEGDALFAMKHSYPLWMARRTREAYGDEADLLAESLNHRAPVDLRVNVARISREKAKERLRFETVKSELTPHSPWGLRIEGNINVNSVPTYREGLVDVQDEGSQLLTAVTGAEPGETIADVCAGGGGKLAGFAALLAGTGTLLAMDVNQNRLRDAQERLTRLGLAANEYITLPAKNAKIGATFSKWAEKCDRVLVDAPCSGTGAWRRHPADRWRLKESEIGPLVETQRDVLDSAATLVKPGGRLVYATCSLLPDENESQAEWFLATHSEFELQPFAELWAEKADVLGTPDGKYFKSTPYRSNTDGFYAAVFRRR
jgi:16S rRNA (cytosine967-C5)-methyltransferase